VLPTCFKHKRMLHFCDPTLFETKCCISLRDRGSWTGGLSCSGPYRALCTDPTAIILLHFCSKYIASISKRFEYKECQWSPLSARHQSPPHTLITQLRSSFAEKKSHLHTHIQAQSNVSPAIHLNPPPHPQYPHPHSHTPHHPRPPTPPASKLRQRRPNARRSSQPAKITAKRRRQRHALLRCKLVQPMWQCNHRSRYQSHQRVHPVHCYNRPAGPDDGEVYR